ncbi:hypothetical protein T484DRAFT_1776182 [Baffinella frigidus]|nr:hypothetical protein T484DRAFT_1776182 [Cryptophyta sp. CCMP2293]
MSLSGVADSDLQLAFVRVTGFPQQPAPIALFYEDSAHHRDLMEMPKSGRTCVFYPRHKKGEGGEPGPLTRYISVNYEALEGLFHLPLKDAAHEIGLCPTTFKKACRSLNIQQWPSRMRCSPTRLALSKAQAGGVDAATRTLRQEPVCAPAAPTLHTTEMHQDKRAGTMTCAPPVWHDGSIAWSDASALCFSFSSNASSSSTVSTSPELRRDCPDPFRAVFSSAAPEGLLQQSSMAPATRSCGEARSARPAFQHKTFAPLDAPSYIDSFPRGSICIGVPMPEGQPTTLPCGGEQGGATPLEAGPPREQSCVEAVMEYLDGPLAENFDFMFADE